MNAEIKSEWEEDKTDRCPFCGSESFDWDESDDGFANDGTHWFVWRCSCCDCDKSWAIEYDMVNPRIYGDE